MSNNKIKNIAIKPIFNNSSKDDINTQSHLNKILNQKTTFESRSLTDIKSKKEISSLMSEINALDKKYKIVLVEVDHELKSNITKEFNDKNTKSILINEFSTRINTKSINEISKSADKINIAVNNIDEMTKELQKRTTRAETFSTDLAHEIRNPLASLKGASELLDNVRKKLENDLNELVRFKGSLLDGILYQNPIMFPLVLLLTMFLHVLLK